jgi:hypothetical protein
MKISQLFLSSTSINQGAVEMNAKKTVSLWTRRSILAKGVLGSAAGLILAACGGGGGGESSSGDAQALRDAFEKLNNGMVWTDVESLVGFHANNQRSDTWLIWVVDGVRLSVDFYSTGSKTITSATIKDGNSVSRSRDFD